MMVAVAGKPHGLAVLADAVRSHDAREIIEKPGKPAAQENNRKQHLHLKGKLLILCPGIFQALDAQRPFSQIKEKKAQAAKKQKKQANSAHQKAGNLKKRAGQASVEYVCLAGEAEERKEKAEQTGSRPPLFGGQGEHQPPSILRQKAFPFFLCTQKKYLEAEQEEEESENARRFQRADICEGERGEPGLQTGLNFTGI